jgi:GT2 family glycosyltransferase
MSDKVLSIVIPVWNKFNFTRACLKDLTQLPADHEIIIVDNGSTDETQQVLENAHQIVYHRNKDNLGFAKACNIGYALAKSPNVLFLNNDIRVNSKHTDWTAEIIEKCPDGLVGPTMGLLDNKLSFVKEENKKLTGNSYMGGWCLGASKEIWQKLELPRKPGEELDVPFPVPQVFSEEFGLAYFEDTDLSFRARKLKIAMNIVTIPVVHFGQQTSKQLNTRALYSQARQIFVKKWGTK